MRGRWWVLGGVLVLAAAGCGDGGGAPEASTSTTSATPAAGPVGDPLSANEIRDLAAQFGDQPLTGGQTAPRLYRWVNDRVAVFLQFDNSDPAKATALRYIGVSVKGCSAPRISQVGRPVRRGTG